MRDGFNNRMRKLVFLCDADYDGGVKLKRGLSFNLLGVHDAFSSYVFQEISRQSLKRVITIQLKVCRWVTSGNL